MSAAEANSPADAERLFHSGKYEDCISACQKAIDEGSKDEAWRRWKIAGEMATGQYGHALKSLNRALADFPQSILLRFQGREVCLYNNQIERAASLLAEIETLVMRAPGRYSDSASRLMLGRYFLLKAEDARKVLELLYDRVREEKPDDVEPYIASADLALGKSDDALAAQMLEKAVQMAPDRADIHYRLARAYAEGDSAQAEQHLAKALELNPRHVDSLLFQVDHWIDAEQYDQAAELLDRVEKINAAHPLAAAYRAVIAHLQGDAQAEQRHRQRALASWPTNPEVDYTIGRKLSHEYRFAEGAQRQRQALQFDPAYLPAKAQLCQDLLRLGQEEEGWKLAREVFQADSYHVVAHNLLALYDSISKYRTLEADGLVVRMDAREADLYGEEVLKLLSRARQTLCPKYEATLSDPVIVEIFAQQKDFAIRTFGLPGGAGFLGVCFGNVITANSPASQGESPTNWQSVLWHEFCHVVTLNKTENKMPRWLSEGISVYEERQANPGWGESMTPQYKAMILGGELTPVSQLSGAFLRPPTPAHLQFAYYESSLVVEHLIAKYGLEALRQVLGDLAAGLPINEALARHAGAMEALDAEFAEFAKRKAEEFAPSADWSEPEISPSASLEQIGEAVRKRPLQVRSWLLYARRLADNQQWKAAEQAANEALELAPDYVGPDSARTVLAEVFRETGDTQAELAVLNEWAARDGDALAVRLRLAQLYGESGQWPAAVEHARAALAINPLTAAPHRLLAQAAEKAGDREAAITACRALLQLAPIDPAGLHHQLAELLLAEGQNSDARRHVLLALEEAPRFRDAHRTLLKIVEAEQLEPPAPEPEVIEPPSPEAEIIEPPAPGPLP